MVWVGIEDLAIRFGGFGEVFFGENRLQHNNSKLWLPIHIIEIRLNRKVQVKGKQVKTLIKMKKTLLVPARKLHYFFLLIR